MKCIISYIAFNEKSTLEYAVFYHNGASANNTHYTYTIQMGLDS